MSQMPSLHNRGLVRDEDPEIRFPEPISHQIFHVFLFLLFRHAFDLSMLMTALFLFSGRLLSFLAQISNTHLGATPTFYRYTHVLTALLHPTLELEQFLSNACTL